MFSGIIESLAIVRNIEHEGTNIHFTFESTFTSELKVDQSVAHNGVCLTVTHIQGDQYRVTAIEETLRLTNLGLLNIGNKVNVERCIRMNDRLDGHIVQGHVDTTATVLDVKDEDGSWIFQFQLAENNEPMVEKGSVCINGVSLTCFGISEDKFSVGIIRYTYEHTNFHTLQKGSRVNIEFDIIGKYLKKLISQQSFLPNQD